MMDELTELMAGSIKVSTDINSTSAEHPRFAQYKQKTDKGSSQEQRRREMLQRQKDKRFDCASHIRQLTTGSWDETGDDDGDDEKEDNMEMEQQIAFRKPGRYYKDQLMLSEWMIEVPADLPDNWLLLPCPVGKRNLVVASRGRTCAYNKGGVCIDSFPSNLPGGGRHKPRWEANCTILDCIYDETQRTFHVIDLMYWTNQPFYDSETEFRFYWLRTKFAEEATDLDVISKSNRYRFRPVPSVECTAENLSRILDSYDAPQSLDGLLFYHKSAHYLFGSTPLVLWLKPYMVPDLLGIEVHEKYFAQRPSSYTSFSDHVQRVTTSRNEMAEKRKKKSEKENHNGEVGQKGVSDKNETLGMQLN